MFPVFLKRQEKTGSELFRHSDQDSSIANPHKAQIPPPAIPLIVTVELIPALKASLFQGGLVE